MVLPPHSHFKTLPDDPSAATVKTLSHQVAGLKTSLGQRDNTISAQEQQITALQGENEHLSAQVQWLERQIKLGQVYRFGSRSEKAHNLQRELFNEAEMIVDRTSSDRTDPDPTDDTTTIPEHQRKKRSRIPSLSDDLVKEVVIHELDESERICPHDQAVLKAIGHESRREVKIIPEQVWAVEHRYVNYACPCCDQTIVSTPREPRLSTGLCSPQAAAAVATNKYVDHLPLYRQTQRLGRSGVPIDRSTLARWMIRHGEASQPLINLMQDVVWDYPYQQLDETTVKVLKTQKKAKKKTSKGAHQGYLWVQRGGPPDKSVILYDYDPGRGGDVARALLAGYSGCVHTDGYPAYIGVMKDLKVTHALCNVHARRRFTDIIKSLSNAPDAPTRHAHVAIEYYKQLYRIEAKLRESRESTEPQVWHEYRLKQRQQQSRPIFEELINWADDLLHRTPPKLALGEALGYLVKHRKGLGVFLDNGVVEMDTNLVENRIRPIALGRRNWLFSDTEHGIKASANLYSLINTAMLNGHCFTFRL